MGLVGDPTSGLEVIIVGGGLVGLSAAIALRQSGHNVTVSGRECAQIGSRTMLRIIRSSKNQVSLPSSELL